MRDNDVGQRRDHTNEIRRLSTLLEISQALAGVLNLRGALHSVLGILERRHEVTGGAVFLIDEDTHALRLEASGGGSAARVPGRPGTPRGSRDGERGAPSSCPR